jgi:hypothetical protein
VRNLGRRSERRRQLADLVLELGAARGADLVFDLCRRSDHGRQLADLGRHGTIRAPAAELDPGRAPPSIGQAT